MCYTYGSRCISVGQYFSRAIKRTDLEIKTVETLSACVGSPQDREYSDNSRNVGREP